MKVVVGLGNPGKEYEGTRHNAGFEVVEKLKTEITKNQETRNEQISNFKFQYQKWFEAEVCKLGNILLVKPQTFMNRSGEAVRKVVDYYKIKLDDVWVVHDDLDIVLGKYKIGLAKGPKEHNGVNSVEERLGNEEFWRVRVGVENRQREATRNKRQRTNKTQITSTNEQREIPGEKYVLMRFDASEQKMFDDVIDEVVDELVERL